MSPAVSYGNAATAPPAIARVLPGEYCYDSYDGSFSQTYCSTDPFLISTLHVNQVGQLASAGIAGQILGEQPEEPCVVAIRR